MTGDSRQASDDGHVCDGSRPDCDCAERAARRLQAERTAEMAAAEDFDPLRIRPYVTLQGMEPAEEPPTAAIPQVESTMPLRLPQAPPYAQEDRSRPEGQANPTDRTDHTDRTAPEAHPPPPPARRRTAYIAAAAVALTVIGTAAFAGGLFSADEDRTAARPALTSSGPTHEPQAPSSEPSGTPEPSKSPSREPSSKAPDPSPTPSPSATEKPSEKPSPPPEKPSPSAPSSPKATDGATPPPAEESAGELRRGDSGPAVLDLQERLTGIGMYWGPLNGRYTQQLENSVGWYQRQNGIESDEPGVYGPNTRRALESGESDW
ncbi:peptidoglycan-binding protein [Streptomyces sp. NPDC050504]|uniref:peptidoglycan-binding protein n=1 Tax=Streptomyces sp. NPDC050504 TaxID=3365618 RepID=UPI00378F15CD